MAEQCGAASLNNNDALQYLHAQGERLRLQNRMLNTITGVCKYLVTFC